MANTYDSPWDVDWDVHFWLCSLMWAIVSTRFWIWVLGGGFKSCSVSSFKTRWFKWARFRAYSSGILTDRQHSSNPKQIHYAGLQSLTYFLGYLT